MGFRFEFLDGFRILMLHGARRPSDKAWGDYLLELRNLDVRSLGLLVFTSGGAPGPAQRQGLNQVLRGRYFARAIVHESPVVRGVVAAVSWFSPGVKAFSSSAWRSAALHARFEAHELTSVASSVRRVHAGMRERIPWLETALARRASLPPAKAPMTSQPGASTRIVR
jgi:hypothetical protein